VAMKKVLVADDQNEVGRILKFKLAEAGYAVLFARDGKECLEQVHRERPDLLVLDVCMPKLDGNEVAVNLKQDPRFKELPIIFLTGLRSKEEEKSEGVQSGDNIIFGKPFNPVEVVDKIREIIGV
jgi:DNA-binding response OmpR family regulator